MLDPRAMIGTGFVHGGALLVAALGLPIGMTTICLCRPWSEPPLLDLRTPSLVTLAVEQPIVTPDRKATLMQFELTSPTCAATVPKLIAAPTLPSALFRDGVYPAICVTVDAAGRVTAARFERSIPSSRGRSAALAAARTTRFEPGNPGTAALRFEFR